MRACVAAMAFLVASAMVAQEPQNIEIPLDTTGVADFTFLNPASVPATNGGAVLFHNTTADRTFIVKMDFVVSAIEQANSFAASKLRRGGWSLRDIVCKAINTDYRATTGRPCTDGVHIKDPATERRVKDALDRVEELRVYIEAVDALEGSALKKADCPQDVYTPRCMAERLYWTAACELCADAWPDPAAKLLTLLSQRSTELVDFLIERNKTIPVLAFETARCTTLDAYIGGRLITTAHGPAVPDCDLPNPSNLSSESILGAAIQDRGPDAVRGRFDRDRLAVAKEALRGALVAELTKTMDAKASDAPELGYVRAALQSAFDKLAHRGTGILAQATETRDPVEAQRDAIESAAKLLSSFGPDSKIPFLAAPPDEKDGRFRYTHIASDYGVAVEDCEEDNGKLRCTASAIIPPRQRARFSDATLRHNPGQLVRFTVSFFGRTAPPPNANAYVQLGRERGKVDAKFGVGLGIDGTSAYDLSSGFRGHNRHTSGTGTASIEFAGGIVDASVSLGFKKGDFGGPESTRDVTLSEYQAKVFSSTGPKDDLKPIVLQYGQFTFARPTSGIAIAEEGEGVLLAYRKLAGSYIIHRESDELDEKPSAANDDYYVTMLEMKNLPLKGVNEINGIDLIAVYGNNKANDPAPKTPTTPRYAYTFTTIGSEIRAAFDKQFLPDLSATFGLYHSRRHVRPHAPADAHKPPVKGKGTVGLLSFGWQWSGTRTLFESERKSRPSFGPTFTIARGTGDDPDSKGRDEGYIGETASFANDKIFLSQLSTDEELADELGTGLKNKWYAGAQWNDARGSLLGWVANHVADAERVESATTNVSLHSYWFVKTINRRRWGGIEFDVEFLLESPADVTWSLGGAYYHRSRAVELLSIADDLWQITAGVSVRLKGN